MDFSQLMMFRAVAEDGSINAAAQRLHRVPSNLTTRIKQLEEELGVELFTREKQRLRLSAQGRQFLDYARRLLDLAEEARLSITCSAPKGQLTLGALESTAAVRIPRILAEYHRRFPEVLLDLSTAPSGEIIEGVLAGRFTAAFVDGPVAHPLLDGMALFDEELVLISAAERGPITRAQDVNGESIYAFRQNCSYRRRLEDWFRRDHSVPGKIHELESYHGMLACVSAGAGLAVLPRSMLETMPSRDSVKAHELDEQYRKVCIYLIWHTGTRLPSLAALVSLLTTGTYVGPTPGKFPVEETPAMNAHDPGFCRAKTLR
jgi:DNA-binding transcriptional LysR family regulator